MHCVDTSAKVGYRGRGLERWTIYTQYLQQQRVLGFNLWVWDWCATDARHSKSEWNPGPLKPGILVAVGLQSWVNTCTNT